MSKYDYLIITTKRSLPEADHIKVLTSYGRQGYRLIEQKKHWLGQVTYTLERELGTPKETTISQGINSRGVIVVPGKYTLEVSEVLLKGIEAQKEIVPLEVKKLLIDWIALNRPDLVKSGKVNRENTDE